MSHAFPFRDILRHPAPWLNNIVHHAKGTEQCLAEADHLHNIPELLRNLHDERLHQYYWEAMRPSFIQVSKPDWCLERFEELWAELEAASKREGRRRTH